MLPSMPWEGVKFIGSWEPVLQNINSPFLSSQCLPLEYVYPSEYTKIFHGMNSSKENNIQM